MKIDQNTHRYINIENNDLFDLKIYDGSKHQLIDQYISGVIKKHQNLIAVFTPNPEQIVLAHSNPHFNAALQSADLLIPDGVGLLLASKLLAAFGKGKALKGRITGVDLLQSIVQEFPAEKAVVIGGRANGEIHIGSARLPWVAGYEDVNAPSEKEEQAVEKFIREEKPSVVFVAFGAPAQEFWTLRHKAMLEKYGVKMVLVVGGAVDVLSGKLKRAPRFMQFLGIEWVFRLIQEPWRWRRQLRLVSFVRLTLQELFSSPN